MKMKRTYPVLANKPIDQWKVTELKEELKKRRLPVKGLKDELIRRLADDIEADEKEQAEAEEAKDVDSDDNIPQEDQNKDEETPGGGESENVVEAAKETEANTGSKTTDAGDMDVGTSEAGESHTANDVVEAENEKETDVDGEVTEGSNIPQGVQTEVEKEPAANEILREASDLEKEVAVEPDVGSNITEGGDLKSSVQVDTDSSAKDAAKMNCVEVQETAAAPTQVVENESVIENSSVGITDVSGNDTSGSVMGMQGSESDHTGKINLDKPNEDIKMQHEEGKHDLHDINNQVSEVSPSLGLPIKNDSISTDSMSVNQNLNALKDNVIADDVKLEPDVKPEIVQPSSSHVVSVSGESHPMDVEAPHENKVSIEETDNNVTNADIDKKNSIADLGGSPEKLNLDRSSGDDSMDEDTLENKQVVYNSDEVGARGVKGKMPSGNDENVVDVMVDVMSTDIKDDIAESNPSIAAAEKRKFPDQEAISSDEPSKRQRRWATEKVVAVEPPSSTVPLATTPREASHAPSLKRSLSRNNSNVSAETPKERVVPPATKAPTDSLRIDNFLRPFTLKAVQELLGKTGTVTSFWMDHIKTHCYVTYSSVEEATETRNAVYNLQWPPNGGKCLAAEFVDTLEVKAKLEGPPTAQPPVAPVTAGGPPPAQPLPSPRQQLGARLKQQQQPVLPPPPPISNVPLLARERVHLPPPPPPLEKMEPPIVTLDDLFRKTKTTPRIYYLPLSEEQVKAKLEARTRNARQ